MSNITIVDSLPGSGKTQWAIGRMNNDPAHLPYMYITPLLSEVARVRKHTHRTFFEPDTAHGKGSKYKDFENLVMQGTNIVSTHSLFTNIQPQILEYIRANKYTLILDEVIDVLESYYVTIKDWKMLYGEYLTVDFDTGKIIWKDSTYKGKHEDIMRLALSNSLYLHSRSDIENETDKFLLVWTFPIEIFSAFENVFILTYMFNGQMQKYYFDLYNTQYETVGVEGEFANGYALTNYTPQKYEIQKLKNLMCIYKGELNTVGNLEYAFSKSWLERSYANGSIEILRNNLYNYFFNVIKSKSKFNMWTTIKGTEDKRDKIRLALAGNTYKRGFVPCNTRATNEFAHKTTLAYAVNRFMNPMDKAFFEDKGVAVDENAWALSEMLQWVFRSAIRNGFKIQIYIPSLRMRNLLQNW